MNRDSIHGIDEGDSFKAKGWDLRMPKKKREEWAAATGGLASYRKMAMAGWHWLTTAG
jgi:mono/diheme cytochrome c family protein